MRNQPTTPTENDTRQPVARQTSLPESTNDAPQTGIELDTRTHYAHARYAASEQSGIIWFDPRDGRERITFDVDTDRGALELGDRVTSGLRLHGHRNMCGLVDPSERWVLRIHESALVEYEPIGDTDTTDERVESYARTELFDDQAAAREAARERFPEYASAPYRDAVAHRLDE